MNNYSKKRINIYFQNLLTSTLTYVKLRYQLKQRRKAQREREKKMEIFNINKNLHYLEKNSKQEQLLIDSINFYMELKLYNVALAITSGLLILKLEKTATEDKPVLFETVKQYFLPYNVDFTSFNVLQSLELN